MITPIFPELESKKDKDEVRKALINLSRQLNQELDAIRDRLKALETP